MKKNWKVLTAIAAVLVIIVVGVVVINLRPGTTTADPEPSQDNTIVAGKFGFPVSTINIGEGGTKIAPDGITPIGYNGTCDSAAQAAANYTPVLADLNVQTLDTQKDTLSSLAEPGPWLTTALLPNNIIVDAKGKETPLKTFDGGWMDQTNVKAGGMYRMVSCTEKKSAVVQVFYGSLSVSDSIPEGYFSTKTMELSWKGDWKISDLVTGVNDEDLVARLKDKGPFGGIAGSTPTGKIPPLDEAIVTQYFRDLSKEGWVEFANATR